jgi:hypothetical protein
MAGSRDGVQIYPDIARYGQLGLILRWGEVSGVPEFDGYSRDDNRSVGL